MRSNVTVVAWSVFVYVCVVCMHVSVTTASPAKTAELIEVSLGCGLRGPKEPCIGWSSGSHRGRHTFGGLYLIIPRLASSRNSQLIC